VPDDNGLGINALIERAGTDANALRELLKRYEPYLRLLARKQIGRRLAAQCDPSDIVQQTLAEAFRAFQSFGGSLEPIFSAWILRIHQRSLEETLARFVRVRERQIRHVRDRGGADRGVSFSWFEAAMDETQSVEHLLRGERALRLLSVLESLPSTQAEAVRLRHLEGWTVCRIAGHLDRTVADTAGLLQRGLRGLRERMDARSWV
jgi:RNA polymerase sigma-70 factor (ECF subfamily)